MKSIITLAAFLSIATLIRAKDIPFHVKSFDNLFKGPPDFTDIQIEGRLGDVTTKWITQKLDHFDRKNNQTWQMRYMENEKYLKDNGPMFIYLGGEWTIQSSVIKKGIFPDLAEEHNGTLFYTEHRYYGHSRPTSNLTVENLQYLHVKQALADVAHFIRYQRETNPRLANSKVIICGGSYSATMVVWFSKLYPELLNGGWASSAPILAKADFTEYKEVTGRALKELGSQQCYDRVKNGIAELEAMFENKHAAEAKAMLQLCNSFDHTNDLDLWTLFDSISNIFAGLVQKQKEGDVPRQCDELMSYDDDTNALASYFLKRATSGRGCVEMKYNKTKNYYSKSSFSESRAWFYQTCNEYGWYQTSGSRNQPFGTKFPLALRTTLCYDVFGPNYTNSEIHELVRGTNRDFGGLDPQVKNVYMTHGALDPWSAMGHNETHGAFMIPRTSHCKDFGSISEKDNPEMRASKQRLTELVREWLA